MPAPPEQKLLRALRIPHVMRIDEVEERGVREAIKLAQRRALGMATFDAVFRVARVKETTAAEVFVEGAPSGVLRSPTLARLLASAEEVAFLASTLGKPWDDALDALAERGEHAEAWFLDAIGTHLADLAARLVEDRIASDMARTALARTHRYRPGYGDWSLGAQAALCNFVEAGRIGVSLNEAMCVLPRKSVTGVLGFRPASWGEDEAGEES